MEKCGGFQILCQPSLSICSGKLNRPTVINIGFDRDMPLSDVPFLTSPYQLTITINVISKYFKLSLKNETEVE